MPEILDDFLTQGVTTVRSTGGYWPWVGDLRDQLAEGTIRGPRMVTSGPVFTTKRGQPATTICAGLFSEVDLDRTVPFCVEHLARVVTRPEEVREDVRGLAAEGVDFIKVVSDSFTSPAPVQIRDTVIEALVDQAHREGLRVVGHVAEANFARRYAEMGMDGFAHLMCPSSIPNGEMRRFGRMLAKHGTPITTTLSATILFRKGGPSREEIQAVLDGTSSRRTFTEAVAREAASFGRAGVPIVVGTDWCSCLGVDHPAFQPGVATVTEMKMLRWGGMPRQAIIQAATANAARALEMANRVGTLEAGKLADLIVVDGNPLDDLSALESVDVVVQGGEIVSGPAGR